MFEPPITFLIFVRLLGNAQRRQAKLDDFSRPVEFAHDLSLVRLSVVIVRSLEIHLRRRSAFADGGSLGVAAPANIPEVAIYRRAGRSQLRLLPDNPRVS